MLSNKTIICALFIFAAAAVNGRKHENSTTTGTNLGPNITGLRGAQIITKRKLQVTGEITGAFEVVVMARFNDIAGGSYQRVFDFGNGAEQDNVWLGQVGNKPDMEFEIWVGSKFTRCIAPGVIVQGELATWTAGVDSNGIQWIEKNGKRICSIQGQVPRNVFRANKLLGQSNWGVDTPMKGAVVGIDITNAGEGRDVGLLNKPEQIRGPFAIAVQARYDAPQGAFWQRVFDFGNGPEGDNIWLGQLGNTNDMVFEIWRDRKMYRLIAPKAIVTGQLASWRVGVDANGLMWMEKAGARIAQTQGIVPAAVQRKFQLLGSSNWAADAPLDGVVLGLSVSSFSAPAQDCQTKFGPIPTTITCDNFSSLGSNAHLDNKAADNLNTNMDVETAAATATRLTGQIPVDPENIQPQYDPVFDAYCFNEDYPVPSLSSSQQHSLYLDYKVEFDKIKEFTTDVSTENNRVTNNRIPGMFLRMCFHDNAVDPTQPDFQHYVASAIDPKTKKWTAEARYMKTSGADASVLICPEERYHPNQNYDQTASRVLRSIQTSLKIKYPHMSYADLMHNGCNAATVYLTQQDPATSLSTNPFTFGRKDACHADKKCSTKYPLCGPTELLPGVELSANAVTHWFTSRGMSECLFMGLMWTHTTVDNMASMCPLQRLTCTAGSSDVDTFIDKTKLYFKAGDNLDYFNFFLKRGTTQTLPVTNVEGAPTCNWVVDGRQVPWPMTGIDCTLGLASVEKSGPVALANVIKNFGHNSQYNRVDILQCALKVLGGAGGAEGGSCDKVIPAECKSNPHHKFGGFYSTLTQSTNVRVPVDPSCQQHYVVAPTPTSRTKSTWWCYDGTKNQGAVTITWGHTEGDAAWACNNWNQWCKSSRRCTAGTSWNCKQGDGKWIGNVDIWWGNTQGDATWACNTWQPNCRSSCRAEWKSIF